MKKALAIGVLSGIICLILGLITHWIYPPFSLDFVLFLSLGTALGNFVIHFFKKDIV